jgi:RNA polymerase sigma-70 factor (ECF subfamily)
MMSAQEETVPLYMAKPQETICWESVVAEDLPRLYNYLRYRLGDEALAEELTSATIERAWLKRGRYRRDRAAFSTWLFAIARNLVIAHYRKQRTLLPLEAADRAGGKTVEEQSHESHDLQRLSELMSALPGRDRELLALKYGAGLTNRAIAGLTGLSESNVGTILHRAVLRLREQWEIEP